MIFSALLVGGGGGEIVGSGGVDASMGTGESVTAGAGPDGWGVAVDWHAASTRTPRRTAARRHPRGVRAARSRLDICVHRLCRRHG
jgi:hypothetical protein